MKITNITGIELPLAVWLCTDGYDFKPNGKPAISATALMKPARQILLRERLTDETATAPDVSDYIASRLGHAIHDAIERAWLNNPWDAMARMGFPTKVINKTKVNPKTVKEGDIPVYIEKRSYREVMGYTITGKFDMILNGVVQDFKSTSVFAWTKGSKDDDYRLQGSIYRWLNPEWVTEDHMNIHFIFTDWSKAQARQSNDYPQQRVMTRRIELMSVEETDAWIRAKIRELETHADKPEDEIPHCSDKDLWRGDTVWKYYSDPTKAHDPKARSSKNFDNQFEAQQHLAAKGKGTIVEVKGQVKACSYCPAFPICTQKDLYEHA